MSSKVILSIENGVFYIAQKDKYRYVRMRQEP